MRISDWSSDVCSSDLHLVIGFTAGIASLRTNLALLKSASLVGVQMRDHALKRPQEAEAMRRKVMELAGEGIFSPLIAERYPLADYAAAMDRSEEHTSELQSLMRISYTVFCLSKK